MSCPLPLTDPDFLRRICASAADAIFILTPDGRIVDATPAAGELFGYPREELRQRKMPDLLPPGEAVRVGKAAEKEAAARTFVGRGILKDGRIVLVEARMQGFRQQGGEAYLAVVIREITGLAEALNALKDQKRQNGAEQPLPERPQSEAGQAFAPAAAPRAENVQAILNAIPDPVFVLRRDGTILDFRGDRERCGLLAGDFSGKTLADVFPAAVAARMMEALEAAFATGEPRALAYEIVLADKTEYCEARIAASGAGEALVIVRNMTEWKAMEQRLKQLSLYDSLTGLYNRSFFEAEMQRLSERRDSPAGILVLDVDGLKVINDSLGHNVGDAILQAVAKILKKSFRSGDIVARTGGDEFTVLLPHNSAPLFEAICQKIQEQIERYNAENPPVPISLSMGFAVSGEAPPNINALFKEAGDRMYRGKLHRQQSARSAIVQALKKALEVRDFMTEGHGDRVESLMESFAKALDLPAQSIPDLRLLARFHDIGKVGIPDSVLFKPGKLTEEEYAVMRRHPEIGYRIAQSAPDLAPIADWILKHQEWWNGGGYPLGLAGDDIPLACRMLSIVDAFDAMTSDRSYRKAMRQDEAIREILKCAGTQFDRRLVGPFVMLVEGISV